MEKKVKKPAVRVTKTMMRDKAFILSFLEHYKSGLSGKQLCRKYGFKNVQQVYNYTQRLRTRGYSTNKSDKMPELPNMNNLVSEVDRTKYSTIVFPSGTCVLIDNALSNAVIVDENGHLRILKP